MSPVADDEHAPAGASDQRAGALPENRPPLSAANWREHPGRAAAVVLCAGTLVALLFCTLTGETSPGGRDVRMAAGVLERQSLLELRQLGDAPGAAPHAHSETAAMISSF